MGSSQNNKQTTPRNRILIEEFIGLSKVVHGLKQIPHHEDTFLTSPLDGGKLSASRPGRFNFGGKEKPVHSG